ncbi:MAG TPA: Ig domain-containing protein [Phycisphaerae bacterium]|nr:Ig domain-containing protein [Phycisphaerae bacterium]HRW55640.1 Ig domain-containing protein [Phycisphaerae bacterium]
MRHEFQWVVPTPNGDMPLTLTISSITGWIGGKVLTFDGAVVYRRGIFAGINQNLVVPGAPKKNYYRLRAAKTGADAEWRPTLYAGDVIIPEKFGTAPPINPRRPLNLAITVGVAYLLIFITIGLWLSIEKTLNAIFTKADSRAYVLVVEDDTEPATFRQLGQKLPAAHLDQPYSAQLSATGGTEPLTWRRSKGRIPPGLSIDESSGRITGTPQEDGDYPLSIRVSDATGAAATYEYVIRIVGERSPDLRITTDQLPNAHVGVEYSATLDAEGGEPPYKWVCNTRKLPFGLKLEESKPDPETDGASDEATKVWKIVGTPQPPPPDAEGNSHAIGGPYALTLRVVDDAYHATNDTTPLLIPIAVSIVCMLGLWIMLRFSLYVFAAVIVIELVLYFAGVAPISLAAVALQSVVCAIGFANIRHMR